MIISRYNTVRNLVIMKKMNTFKDQNNYVTTSEAASILGVSLRTIQLWVDSGELKAWKTVGGNRRISKSAISKILKKQQFDMEETDLPEKTLKILVVEDEPELLQAYQVHINSWGFNCQVITAKDGYEGLLQIGEHHPELIFSDLLMPDMDGFRMIRSLKDRKETKGSQIVAVTILNSEEIKEHGGLPSDVMVLNKPISFDVIKGLVMARIAIQKSH